MKKLASLLVDKIYSVNPTYTDLQIRTMKFGLECLLGELVKFIVYFFIFAFMSLGFEYLVMLACFCVIRGVAGGYHNEKYWQCFITTFTIFSVILAAGSFINFNFYLKIAVLAAALILTYLFAPVDHPNKPIINPKRRQKFKYYSLAVMLVLGLVTLIPGFKVSGIISATVGIAAILLPLGYLSNRAHGRQAI